MTQRVSSGGDRLLAMALAMLFPLSTLWFATVDETPRLLMAVLSCGLVSWVLFRPRGDRAPGPTVAMIWSMAGLAVLWMLTEFLQVGPGVRAFVQPGLAPLIDRLLAVGGVFMHPLALQPRVALISTLYGISVLGIALASALVAPPRRKPAGGADPRW